MYIAILTASLSLTISQSLPKFMSILLVMPSSHLIFWCFLLLPSIFPSIRKFSSKSAVRIRWSKYWSFRFSISLFSEYSGLISLKIDWFDFLTVQGTFRSLLQHHRLKALILWCSSFFTVSSHIRTWSLGRCIVKAMVFPVLHMKKLSFLHCVVLPPLS